MKSSDTSIALWNHTKSSSLLKFTIPQYDPNTYVLNVCRV